MARSFSAAVNAWATKTKERNEAIFKTAVQEVVYDANTPTEQGGRMRVDTGFLRNSLVANLNSPPTGPSNPDSDPQGNDEEVALTILGAKVTDIIWVGWSANYARAREYYDGFLLSAAKKWERRVREATAEAKRRFP